MKGLIYCCLALNILVPLRLASAVEKQIVGWVEKVRLLPSDILIQAKLDTGADYSSLSASNVQDFMKNSEEWVSFEVQNSFGDKKTIEQRVHRIASIKRHGGKVQKRPVIRLGICIADHYMEADVNLVDRNNFDFQMLIGRNVLAGNVLVDPASTYTSDPKCKGASKR